MSVIIFCNPHLTGSPKDLPSCSFKKQTGVNVKATTTVVASIPHTWTPGSTQIQIPYSTNVKVHPNHSSIGMKGHLTYTSQHSSQAKKANESTHVKFSPTLVGEIRQTMVALSPLLSTPLLHEQRIIWAQVTGKQPVLEPHNAVPIHWFCEQRPVCEFYCQPCLLRVEKLKP